MSPSRTYGQCEGKGSEMSLRLCHVDEIEKPLGDSVHSPRGDLKCVNYLRRNGA